MGSLNNLYISQSYQGLLTFSTNSGSTSTLTQISDGTGQGLGLYLNNSGSASLSADMYIGGDLTVSGAFDIEGAIVIRDNVYVTGSIYSSADISSSRVLTGEITASNMTIAGTLNVYEIHTTIESSSVIFSTGSNILGDSILDTQTLNGTVIVSGSEQVTGSLYVSNEISSSTINGIGNVTTYSQSVDARLDYLEGPFSTSVDLRLDQLENFSSSLQTDFATQAELTLTASVLQNNINTKLNTSSFNDYTQSTATQFNSYTSSTNSRLNVIETTYATTGSNSFVGTETITGSLIVSASVDPLTVYGDSQFNGRVNGIVTPLTILSQTASFDCSLGNFYTVTLASGSNTLVNAINVTAGQTISLKILQPNPGYGTVTVSSNIKFPQAFPYIATPISQAEDVLTFVSYGDTLYGVSVNTMV